MKRIGLILLLLLAACTQQTIPEQATAVATPTIEPATQTPVPTNTAEPTPTDTAVPSPTATLPLTTLVLGAHYGGVPAGIWEKTNWEAFLAEHPEVEGQLRQADYYSAYVNRTIHIQLSDSNNPPDVFTAALGGVLYDFVEQGIIADITDLWEEQGWDELFPASVKEMASVNGRQYFVPTAIQWNGIFYRADVMAEAGVAPPATWEELLAACDALRAADITPFVITETASWPPPLGFWFTHINQRLNGPDFHEQLMRGDVSYTDPRVREVFDYYAQLFEHRCFSVQSSTVNYGRAITQFESGDFAMYVHGEWLYEFIDEETKQVTEFIRFPIIDESVPIGELVPMYGAFMLAETAQPELAREFLIFAAGEASQQSNVNTLKRLPSNLNVDRSDLLPVYETGLQTVEEATTLTQLIGANTHPDVAFALLQAIVEFWRNPEEIDALLAEVEAVRLEAYGD
ncbi:ABC transporter substrate-binding protein [Candidatus Leptofilum sp.]|uniref:ABC transporter substrate-binding protein n=1 Tax=Candidatus Leptofilum sp. TaxID=3241576 RepID=UPI003B5AC263